MAYFEIYKRHCCIINKISRYPVTQDDLVKYLHNRGHAGSKRHLLRDLEYIEDLYGIPIHRKLEGSRMTLHIDKEELSKVKQWI